MPFDITIIGAGIVGLSTAWKILEKSPGARILILEKEDGVARHQTGNNSGVIHSGIYYKPGSLKAKNCLSGYRELIRFSDKYDIPYDLCGKIIVAVKEKELPVLEELYKRGLENGLKDISLLDGSSIRDYEPYAEGLRAIHVPYAGIIDYTRVCETLADLVSRQFDCTIRFSEKVVNILYPDKDTEVITVQDNYPSKIVINTAGLYSDEIAALNIPDLDVRIIPFRGEYFQLQPEKEYLVKNLIYPVPDPDFPFLGVHFTRMIKGGVEAGPNAVFAFKKEGYRKTDFSFEDIKNSLGWPGFRKIMGKYWKMGLGEYYRSYNKHAFTAALQKLLPEIRQQDLVPGGAGIRAQACHKNGHLLDDFSIVERGNIINVLNAPSPAATASLAIGDTIAEIALRHTE